MAKRILFEYNSRDLEDGATNFSAAGISYAVGHGAPRGSAVDGYDVMLVRMYLHAAGISRSRADLDLAHCDAKLIESIRNFQKWVNKCYPVRVATDGRMSVPRSSVYGWNRGMGGTKGSPTPWTIEVLLHVWRANCRVERMRPVLSAHPDCPKVLQNWLRAHGL